jgi:hypothetical protein
MLDRKQFVSKVRATQAIVYREDVPWTSRMIAQVQTQPKPSNCVHCQIVFQPRYIGEQACEVCRCAN